MSLRIRGVPAAFLIVGFVAFAAWRGVAAYTDLQDGAAKELATWLRAEYARDQLRGVQDAADITPPKLDSLLGGQNVTFASLKARGSPNDMVVRVEALIDGRPTQNGAVRYYHMSYSAVAGWRVGSQVRALAFYTKVF